jgi:hypothetical protein
MLRGGRIEFNREVDGQRIIGRDECAKYDKSEDEDEENGAHQGEFVSNKEPKFVLE